MFCYISLLAFADQFSGHVEQLVHCVCVCVHVSIRTKLSKEMIHDLSIWLAGLPEHYVGQV